MGMTMIEKILARCAGKSVASVGDILSCKVDFAVEGGVPWTNEAARRAGTVHLGGTLDEAKPGAWGTFGQAGAMGAEPFASPISNFYMTDPISRASPTMAECTSVFLNGQARTGTHG